MTHPVAQTLRRGRALVHAGCHLGLHVDPGEDVGWVTTAALAEDHAGLQSVLDQVGHEMGSGRRDVQASMFLESYAWRLLLPLAGALVAEQRVIAPTPRDVKLRPIDGRCAEVRLAHCRFYVLRGDPAEAHRDASPVSPPASLAAMFEGAVVDHFETMVAALKRNSGRSERALWLTIADRTATALLYAGLACSDDHRGERLAHQVLRGVPPLQGTAAYATRLVGARHARVHLRNGCCLWWRTTGATYCATCPLQLRTAPTA